VESEASDKEQESSQEGLAKVDDDDIDQPSDSGEIECVDMLTLLKLRYSIDPLEGYEERLLAMEISSDDPLSKVLAPPPATPSSSSSARGKTSVERNKAAKKNSVARESRPDPFDALGESRKVEAKKLTMGEDSWLAQQRARRSVNQEAESPSDADVVRTMKSILNKLTMEKFAPLYEKLVSCGIQTTVHLEALINEVFEKATTQHHFINMYADLCTLLHTHFVEHPITDDPKMTFKKILLNGCQAFFEKHLKPPTNLESLSEEDRGDMTRKYKMQMLGNITFVGALLVRQMLASKVMFAIMEELLTEPTAETLESLACLLTVVGPKFDTPEWPGRPMLMDIFNRVQVLTKVSAISCRVRCLLKDVLELRATPGKIGSQKKWKGHRP